MDSKNQIRIGFFLGLGLLAVLSTIMFLGGDRAIFTRYATIYARLEQVQGLNKGSVVSLAGINIGNVRSIDFSKEQKSLIVDMKIDTQYLTKLTKGSTAEVRTQGALGDKYIYVTPGNPEADTLSEGDYLETARGSDLMGVLSEKGGDAAKIFEIIDELTKLMKTINAQNRPEKIMGNFAETSASLKDISADMKKILAELKGQSPAKLKESLERLSSILAKIDKGEGTLGALINDPSIHDQIKSYLGASGRKKSIQSLIKSSVGNQKDESSP